MSTHIRTIIFTISGILLLAGAILYLVKLEIAPWLFAFGSAGIAVSHLTSPVKHLPLRKRRLQTFKVIAGLLMVVASVFMFKQQNEWILCLTIAAILHLYAVLAGDK
jgi:hypothetical protein